MVVKARLRNAIEEVTLKESGGKRTYANPAGHGLLEELQGMNKEVKNLREGATNQASFNASIDARVTQLQSFADGFKEVRQRIFTVYKRDIKGMSHLSRSKAIVVGNAHAHDADALMDAKLLDSDPFWPDRSTYCELYGCEFDKVLAYGTYTDHSTGRKLIKNIGKKIQRRCAIPVWNPQRARKHASARQDTRTAS